MAIETIQDLINELEKLSESAKAKDVRIYVDGKISGFLDIKGVDPDWDGEDFVSIDTERS